MVVCISLSYYRRDKWAVYSLEDGLETLVERLRDRLKSDGVEIRTGAAVESVAGTSKGGAGKKANVALESGEEIACDHGEFMLSKTVS